MGQPDWKITHKGISIAGWKGEQGWSFTLPTKRYKNATGEWCEAKSLIDWPDNSDVVTMAAVACLAAKYVGKLPEVSKKMAEIEQGKTANPKQNPAPAPISQQELIELVGQAEEDDVPF